MKKKIAHVEVDYSRLGKILVKQRDKLSNFIIENSLTW